MTFFIIDISGRVLKYDLALHQAIQKASLDDNVVLLMSDAPKETSGTGVKSLIKLVPNRFKSTENTIKRLLKAVEGIINYTYILILCIFKKPDIIHFQWLPFSEICSLEIPILKLYRFCIPKCKMVLTIHNIFPHNYNEKQKEQYKKRFLKLSKLFDAFFVHTNNSKQEVMDNFLINENKISVIHHGIFEPDLTNVKKEKKKETGRYRLISYGHQDPYKGTDLLLEAVSALPKEYKEKVELSIIGRGQPSFVELLKKKGEGLQINWKLFFVDDAVLYQEIEDADAIVLPYRNISQSGVLLLALYFDKPIICSDLPAFIETLDDYPSELFFKSGDSDSLKETILRQLENRVDDKKLKISLKDLRAKYSWESAGILTSESYKRIIKK